MFDKAFVTINDAVLPFTQAGHLPCFVLTVVED